MNADIKSVREVWNCLFDNSLENFAKEDVQFRSLAMVLHILQLEFQKTKLSYFELQQKSEKQAKELHDYEKKLSESPQLLECIKPVRSPLKTLSINETITSNAKQNVSLFDDEGDADLFNSQLNEVDINLSKENDQSLFIEDSFEDYDTIKSPTLNKSRKNRSIKKAKRNVTINQSTSDCSIILGTPIKIVKNPKQSKLSACYSISGITKLKSSLSLKNNQAKTSNNNKLNEISDFNDSDETLCFAAQKSEVLKKEITEQVSVDDILKELEDNEENKRKKQKLEDSYDCIPEKKSSSPEYAYKREAVRKKNERLKLQGWACADCEKYYTKYHHLTDEELQKRMDICSKHRNKFNPNILTPKGFWDVDFPPTQESMKFDV